jgi:hypothetical protein
LPSESIRGICILKSELNVTGHHKAPLSVIISSARHNRVSVLFRGGQSSSYLLGLDLRGKYRTNADAPAQPGSRTSTKVARARPTNFLLAGAAASSPFASLVQISSKPSLKLSNDTSFQQEFSTCCCFADTFKGIYKASNEQVRCWASENTIQSTGTGKASEGLRENLRNARVFNVSTEKMSTNEE